MDEGDPKDIEKSIEAVEHEEGFWKVFVKYSIGHIVIAFVYIFGTQAVPLKYPQPGLHVDNLVFLFIFHTLLALVPPLFQLLWFYEICSTIKKKYIGVTILIYYQILGHIPPLISMSLNKFPAPLHAPLDGAALWLSNLLLYYVLGEKLYV